jgi:hypothetical protein
VTVFVSVPVPVGARPAARAVTELSGTTRPVQYHTGLTPYCVLERNKTKLVPSRSYTPATPMNYRVPLVVDDRGQSVFGLSDRRHNDTDPSHN